MKLFPLITISAVLFTGIPFARAWTTDYDQAVSMAKTNHEFLFLNFTTSDRNPTTAMSNTEILGQDKFNEFTKDKLVLVDIYMYPKAKLSPADRKRNEALAEQYGVTKYPTAVITDCDGKELGELPYTPGGVDAYLTKLGALLQRKP